MELCSPCTMCHWRQANKEVDDNNHLGLYCHLFLLCFKAYAHSYRLDETNPHWRGRSPPGVSEELWAASDETLVIAESERAQSGLALSLPSLITVTPASLQGLGSNKCVIIDQCSNHRSLPVLFCKVSLTLNMMFEKIQYLIPLIMKSAE